MTTFRRQLAARELRRPRLYLSTTLLGAVLAVVLLAGMSGGRGSSAAGNPNLSHDIAGVTCLTVHDTANAFTRAVNDATKLPPSYAAVKTFGFTPPTSPRDIVPFQELLNARRDQLNQKMETATNGTCTDNPTASVIDANGAAVTLPLVDGNQPNNPVSGSESNLDPRTTPVTAGTLGDKSRTETWSQLDKLYGDQKWYTGCTNSNLDMDWDKDVPKFVATETEHDNRFILAVNVSPKLTDDQIREQAAEDGNRSTGLLPVVRTASIINTRHLGDKRCDNFVHTRSQIRVSLGKPVFNKDGSFQKLDMTEGVFVDCHNMWRLPKSTPVPTTPPTTPPSGTTPPGTTPPHTTPPTTSPPGKCKPPTHDNGHGVCVESKDPNQGAGHNGNVPTQVQGTNPPVTSDPEPAPTKPPSTYVPPPPPKATKTTTQPAATRTTVPPPETSAPKPSNPATGCVPPPGMSSC